MHNKPKYNPQIHHRRSIRLKGYDYSQAGLYFITICCQGMICRFGHIDVGESLAGSHSDSLTDSQMILNEYGQIAYNEWIKLSERFPNMELDVFQIMPNHMHGIIILNNPVGATLAVAPDDDAVAHDARRAEAAASWAGASPPPTIGDIIGAYKSLVANSCLEIYKSKNEIMGKLWQRNYYEHIIRNERSYLAIFKYIITNPSNWKDDKFYR